MRAAREINKKEVLLTPIMTQITLSRQSCGYLSALILPIMPLVACTEAKTILVKEGISEQEMQSDMAECDKDPTAIGYVKRSNEDFARCIMAKGYSGMAWRVRWPDEVSSSLPSLSM